MHWAGLTELTGADCTPIALHNFDNASVLVRADSDGASTRDVLDAIEAEPGAHKSSGTGQGGIRHLAMAVMLNASNLPPDASPRYRRTVRRRGCRSWYPAASTS